MSRGFRTTASRDIVLPSAVRRRGAATPSSLLSGLREWWPLTDMTPGIKVGAHAGITLTRGTELTRAGIGSGPGSSIASSFEGVGVSCADATALRLGDIDWTIAFGFYLASTVTAGARLVSKRDNATSFDYDISFNGSQLGVIITSSGGTYVVHLSESLQTSRWYHALVYHDAAKNTLGISIDGAAASTISTGGIVPAVTSAPFMFGDLAQVSRVLWGRMKGLGIWGRLLTTAERAALYNSGAGATYPFA